MPVLETRVTRPAQLNTEQRSAMHDLFRRYYANSSEQQFNRDLDSKDYVILLFGEKGTIEGFSSLANYLSEATSRRIQVIYSGDTIISQHCWGTQRLPRAWCTLAGQLKQHYPDLPLYWLLIVKGYRTYRYLPLFSHRFFPNHRLDTPPEVLEMIDQLALEKFGDAWHPDEGIVRYPLPKDFLTDDFSTVRPQLLQNPHVRFFFDRNPGYTRGDELVCLTELTPANLRSLARRAFLSGMNLDTKESPCVD